MNLIVVQVVAAAVVAGVLGWFMPRVIAALPEPEEPDDDKPLYVDLAALPRLGLFLGAGAAVLAASAASAVPAVLVPAWTAFAVVGATLTYIDLRTRLLPFALTSLLHAISMVLVAVAAAVSTDWTMILRALVANVVVFAVYWVIWWAGERFAGGGFGYGDVRAGAICALLLGAVGAREVFIGTYAGFVLGAVVAIVLAVVHRSTKRYFAFGPYIVVGAVVGLVATPYI